MNWPLKGPLSFTHYERSPDHKVRLDALFRTNPSASPTFVVTPVTSAAAFS